MTPTTLPQLLAISDRRRLSGGRLGAWLDALAAAGVGAVQLREKDLGGEELLELAIAARRRLGEAVRLLINGRADVAVAAACRCARCRRRHCGGDSARISSSAARPTPSKRWRRRRGPAPTT